MQQFRSSTTTQSRIGRKCFWHANNSYEGPEPTRTSKECIETSKKSKSPLITGNSSEAGINNISSIGNIPQDISKFLQKVEKIGKLRTSLREIS